MSRVDELRAKLVRNVDEVQLREERRDPLYESRGGPVIGARVPATVARKLGATVDILAPGKITCPYHFHYAQEEMFIEGTEPRESCDHDRSNDSWARRWFRWFRGDR